MTDYSKVDLAAFMSDGEVATPKKPQVSEENSFAESLMKGFRELMGTEEDKPYTSIGPTTRGGARKKPSFNFKRGDVSGNLQQILGRAESPDYITIAGGRKVRELKTMTAAEIGKQFGNKAVGRYQIQRNTAFDVLKNAGLDPNKFIFDEAGQDKLYGLLLNRRGYQDYKSGKITKQEFANRLSMEWAGLPKDESGVSFHAGTGNNKAHVSWEDVLRALD